MPLPPVTTARSNFLKRPRIMIFSPPKHGKTFLAATKSKFFVGWNRPKGEVIMLKDMHWVAFDPDAVEGLNEQGYDAPITDLSGQVGPLLLPALTSCAIELQGRLAAQAKQYGLAPEDISTVVDTVSFLDKNITSIYVDKYEKWDLHRMIGATHMKFVDVIKALAGPVFVLAHAKSEFAATTPDAVAAKLATDLPGSGGVSSAITGATKGTYEGMVSMILPMLSQKVLDPKNPQADATGYVVKRTVYPFGGNGMEGASRYTRYLAKEEPADLAALFDKIRRGVETNWGNPSESPAPTAGSNPGAK